MSESFISKQIKNENNQFFYIFSLNRYTGEFWHFVAPTYTDGVYSLYFSGSCEKAKVKVLINYLINYLKNILDYFWQVLNIFLIMI